MPSQRLAAILSISSANRFNSIISARATRAQSPNLCLNMQEDENRKYFDAEPRQCAARSQPKEKGKHENWVLAHEIILPPAVRSDKGPLEFRRFFLLSNHRGGLCDARRLWRQSLCLVNLIKAIPRIVLYFKRSTIVRLIVGESERTMWVTEAEYIHFGWGLIGWMRCSSDFERIIRTRDDARDFQVLTFGVWLTDEHTQWKWHKPPKRVILEWVIGSNWAEMRWFNHKLEFRRQ